MLFYFSLNGSKSSVVIKDVSIFKTAGFVTRIIGLIVEKLTPDSSNASLGSDLGESLFCLMLETLNPHSQMKSLYWEIFSLKLSRSRLIVCH